MSTMGEPADPGYDEMWDLTAALSAMVDHAKALGFQFGDEHTLTGRQRQVLAMVDRAA